MEFRVSGSKFQVFKNHVFLFNLAQMLQLTSCVSLGHRNCIEFSGAREQALQIGEERSLPGFRAGQPEHRLSPLGTSDYGPYLAQLKRDVDAVYAVFSGADALRFAKQYAEAGLKDRLPLIGGGTFTDEHVLRTLGDESLGIVTALHLLGRARHASQQEVLPSVRG